MAELKEPVRNLDFLRNEVLKDPNRFIPSAIDEVLKRDKELTGDNYDEDNFTLEVLRYLFPTAEYYWTDEDLVRETKNILKNKIKIISNEKFNNSDVESRKRFIGNGISGASHYEDWANKNEE
ncbi:MAG: hypothetical protein V3574_03550 [Candidatus Moraniibacteriota bacterium]